MYTLRYEDLLRNCHDELRRLLDWADLTCDPRELEAVVAGHDASRMRAGLVPWMGNLDEGGRSRSWRETMTREQARLVEPYLREAIEGLGYANDDG